MKAIRKIVDVQPPAAASSRDYGDPRRPRLLVERQKKLRYIRVVANIPIRFAGGDRGLGDVVPSALNGPEKLITRLASGSPKQV